MIHMLATVPDPSILAFDVEQPPAAFSTLMDNLLFGEGCEPVPRLLYQLDNEG